MLNFFNETVVTSTLAASASAGTEVDGGAVDSAEFDGTAFIASLGTANAGNYFKLQGGQLANASDMADLAGSKIVPTVDGQAVVVAVERSTFRYHRLVAIRAGANSTASVIYAVRYRTKSAALSSNVGKQLVSPIAGTA